MNECSALVLGFAGTRMNKCCERRGGSSVGRVALRVLAVVAALSAPAAGWSELTAKPILKVEAGIRAAVGVGGTLTPVRIFFTPSVVNVGTVTIVARNYDDEAWHQLSVNGVDSRWMGPGSGTAVMRVTFKRPGKYIATVNVEDGEIAGSGLIQVLK